MLILEVWCANKALVQQNCGELEINIEEVFMLERPIGDLD